jgi:DNA mismatch repair ATPase MutS
MATHFSKVYSVFGQNPQVASLHLQVSKNSNEHILKYEYKLKNGSCSVQHYGMILLISGIDLAKQIGFPNDVLETADSISKKLESTWEEQRTNNEVYIKSKQTEAEVALTLKLIQVMKNSTLDDTNIREYLKTLRGISKV